MADIYKAPRVFLEDDLSEGITLKIEDSVHHYLKNVMRVPEGASIRTFNGRDGEFRARVERIEKKSIEATVENKVRVQSNPAHKLHLLFAPLNKDRMNFLIEKAVELGVTDLHPVTSQNLDTRKINSERLNAQIIEAAEQCERMNIPVLHDSTDLFKKLAAWTSSVPVLAAIERIDAPLLQKQAQECALLIGPPGGFTTEEKEKLAKLGFVHPVSLGENILRTETAVIAGLAILTI